MNILCYRHSHDSRFESILLVLSKTKYNVGYSSGDLSEKNISEFKPDVILHNIEDASTFPIKNNAINININETESDTSFSFKNTQSKNYIDKFVDYKDCNVPQNQVNKYQSDLLYIGTPIPFNSLLNKLVNYDPKIFLKFFNHKPHNIIGYCGMCDARDYFKFYRHAKASLVEYNDMNRLMDIIVSDGNPIVYDSNDDECIEKINQAVYSDKKFTVDGLTKESIIENHTSFDRTAKIFRTVGLNKVAEHIMQNKKEEWYKK
jgi:hypothetical protein